MSRLAFICLVVMTTWSQTVIMAADPAKTKQNDPDYKALSILAKNCAGCHQAADHPGALFLNEARLSEPETIKLIKNLVETSQMPPAHAKFKKSADGKFLLKWLKSKEQKSPTK